MSYVSKELLRLALASLRREYSPLLIVSLPCMLANKIPTAPSPSAAAASAIQFGSGQEKKWLDEYFRPGGGPAEHPYYMPGTGEWVEERYPGRSLQRRRKDFEDSVFFHPTKQTWAIRPDAATALREKVLRGNLPVPLVALMAWMWRDRELPSLDGLLEQFISEIGFDRDRFIGSVFSRDIPQEFSQAGLAAEPLSQETLAELIGATPPPPTVPGLASFTSAIEEHLRRQQVALLPNLVRRILGGWLVGDIVVLVGAPGTGKTFLADALCKALGDTLGGDRFWSAQVEVTRDLDVGQFLGYENLAGDFTPGVFAREILFRGEASDPRLVILDEWNLAQIDAYFAPILSAIESRRALSLPGKVDVTKLPNGDELKRVFPDIKDQRCPLPEDTLFLATCNSWVDEPETRLPISGPVKRRCRIIQVPNLLELRFQTGGLEALMEVCDTILRQERERVTERVRHGRVSMWDAYRDARLGQVPTFESLHEPTRRLLLQIARLLLETPETKGVFTIGILRDVLLACVYAEPGSEMAALGEQIADKIIHQVQGDPKLLERMVQVLAEVPNLGEIRELAQKMGAFGAERRIRPLV